MMCQVDDGLLVGRGHVLDDQLVVVAPCELHCYINLASESLFTIATYAVQGKSSRPHLAGIPNTGVESRRTTMQMVDAIVNGRLILLAVQCELSFADAVAPAANKG